MPVTLAEIAEAVAGELRGEPGLVIRGVNSVTDGAADELVALEDERLFDGLAECRAGALLLDPKHADKLDRPGVLAAFPQVALNRVIDLLDANPEVGLEGVHSHAQIDPSAELGEGCAVGPGAVVGPGARIGAGSRIHAHAIVEGGAVLGERCIVHPHAVIGRQTRAGDEVVVGAHAVVAGCGFGFGFTDRGPVRLHHIGTVELGNRVEIGPSATVDRGRFGVTRLGDGVKLDAHVHVAHNCTIGPYTVLAAQVGLAGSSHLGSACLLGGQVGVAGHLHVADGVQLAAKSGVASSLEKPGPYFGHWAKPRGSALRELSALAKLPNSLKELKGLQKEVAALRSRLAEVESSTHSSSDVERKPATGG